MKKEAKAKTGKKPLKKSGPKKKEAVKAAVHEKKVEAGAARAVNVPKETKKLLEANDAEAVVEKETGASPLEKFDVLLYPLITEKAVNMIESENKLSFIVGKKATKQQIREALESAYAIKIDSVKVLNDMKGRKKAIVKVNRQFKADEIATKLGVI